MNAVRSPPSPLIARWMVVHGRRAQRLPCAPRPAVFNIPWKGERRECCASSALARTTNRSRQPTPRQVTD